MGFIIGALVFIAFSIALPILRGFELINVEPWWLTLVPLTGILAVVVISILSAIAAVGGFDRRKS